MNIKKYKTLIFDCDGVILNSNNVKTQAFYNSALAYGEKYAQSLVDYHVKNGGISRYKKFELFLTEIIPEGVTGPNIQELLALYGKEVRKGLLNCEVAEGLAELREQTPESKWLIISGGDQNELRDIFSQRNLAHLFDGGIFGSPDTKDEILQRELSHGCIKKPAVFLGDSLYDCKASTNAGLDFIFVSSWTEYSDWKKFCESSGITYIKKLSNLTVSL